MRPNCPKCGCGEQHVEETGYARVRDREIRVYGCNACGHVWSVKQPSDS